MDDWNLNKRGDDGDCEVGDVGFLGPERPPIRESRGKSNDNLEIESYGEEEFDGRKHLATIRVRTRSKRGQESDVDQYGKNPEEPRPVVDLTEEGWSPVQVFGFCSGLPCVVDSFVRES